MATRYIFVRHAEAFKNKRKVVGGIGSGLTENGKQQVKKLNDRLDELTNNKDVVLFSSPKVQARETAKIISEHFNCNIIESSELSPSDMGVLTGLSEDEMQIQYPEEYSIFKKWRRKEIDVTGLMPLKISDPIQFWNRIMGFIEANLNEKCNVVVCTTSIMVLISNYVSGHKPYPGGNYMHVETRNCECIAFDLEDDGSLKVVE